MPRIPLGAADARSKHVERVLTNADVRRQLRTMKWWPHGSEARTRTVLILHRERRPEY
jgi:hypothetical protein